MSILHVLPVITAFNISKYLMIQERQAQRYMAALLIAMPSILKGMPATLTTEDAAFDNGRVDEYDDEPHSYKNKSN
jgi:hypothetical protein